MIAEDGGTPVTLLAYVEGEPGESDVTWASEMAEEVRHGWALDGIEPPAFVNEGVDSDHTVGALLRLPAVSSDLAQERQALRAVEVLVEALEGAVHGDRVVALELDGVVVGWVENGARDRMLDEGLLIPWRERVEGGT